MAHSITYKQVDQSYLVLYDCIPMRVEIANHFKINRINNGLGGFTLVETALEPYIKDFIEEHHIYTAQ